jgi:hypothetical protein
LWRADPARRDAPVNRLRGNIAGLAPLSLQQQWSDDMADNTARDIRKVAI